MTKTINNRKKMTTKELEIVSGGTVPWAAISVGIACAKLTYDLSYAAGKSFCNLKH
ncbi:class IIb bacteriocin, lactobin A/cerein 7B family [Streptococcus thermophilus]|nr:class IIb bacteriocin, lactobin A/cerein 7B family [Streptococcus thermophilus]MCE2083689.1 class IIb bacteriocin, lactobin A/cerein 7B family [Streptococcus thermophilus]